MVATAKGASGRSVVAVVLLLATVGGLAGCLDSGDGGPGGGANVGAGSGGGGPADWPMHGFDAGNSGSHGSPGDGNGDVVWQNTSTDTQSSPAISNGLVLVGEEDGLSAWGAATGELAWWFEDDALPEDADEGRSRELTTPVVLDGTVFVASTLLNHPGRILAVDADTGEEEWRVELDDGLRSSPSVGDGLVYVGTERVPNSGNAAVHALDADSGEEAWTFDVGDNPHVYGSPIFSDGSVFFGTQGGISDPGIGDQVYKLDAETGEEEWRAGISGTTSSVAVGDGTVFVDARDQVIALDEATGEEIWTHEDVEEIGDDPVIADGSVYVVDEDEGELIVLDADSGEEAWTFDGGNAPPAVAGGTVFATSFDEGGNVTVHALDASDGQEAWAATLGPADEVLQPAFAGGTLVVTQERFPEASLFALDA